MFTYSQTGDANAIQRSDGAIIPNDPGNIDYIAYLAWVAAGNTPTPLPATPPALQALLQLEAQDALMFRGLEVLIDVLLAKGVIAATDFSPTIRTLYAARKALRTTAGVP